MSKSPRRPVRSLAEERKRRRLLLKAEREERKLEALRRSLVSREEMRAAVSEVERRLGALFNSWGENTARALAVKYARPYQRTRAQLLLSLRAKANDFLRGFGAAALGGFAPDARESPFPLRPEIVAEMTEGFWRTILAGLSGGPPPDGGAQTGGGGRRRRRAARL